jgi:hypothetical protein
VGSIPIARSSPLGRFGAKSAESFHIKGVFGAKSAESELDLISGNAMLPGNVGAMSGLMSSRREVSFGA